MAQSYVERAPRDELAGAVRRVWVQRTGGTAYVQRHLPTGGVEVHVPIGGRPQLVGPLTGPLVEVIPAGTTVVGVRFHPGMAPPSSTALDDLVDERLDLTALWGATADRLGSGWPPPRGPRQRSPPSRPSCWRSAAGPVTAIPWCGRRSAT